MESECDDISINDVYRCIFNFLEPCLRLIAARPNVTIHLISDKFASAKGITEDIVHYDKTLKLTYAPLNNNNYYVKCPVFFDAIRMPWSSCYETVKRVCMTLHEYKMTKIKVLRGLNDLIIQISFACENGQLTNEFLDSLDKKRNFVIYNDRIQYTLIVNDCDRYLMHVL